MTPEHLQKIAPNAGPQAGIFFGPINDAMAEFGISTPWAQAAFLAQILEETAGLTRLTENLNYSAPRLVLVWPRRFPTLQAAGAYANNPEVLANYVYAGRLGNGDPASGDGWTFRGMGLPMLTGRNNFTRAAEALGYPLVAEPGQILEPVVSARAAGWFWSQAGCNAAAEAGDFDAVCDLWNLGRHTEKQGDAIGFADRQAYFNRGLKELA